MILMIVLMVQYNVRFLSSAGVQMCRLSSSLTCIWTKLDHNHRHLLLLGFPSVVSATLILKHVINQTGLDFSRQGLSH